MLQRTFRWLLLASGMAGLGIQPLQRELFNSQVGAQRSSNPTHEQLLGYLEGARPIEAWISGIETYKPYHPAPTLPPAPGGRAPSSARGGTMNLPARIPLEIVREIELAARRQPSPENLASLGLLHLSTGNAKDAVSLLRAAYSLRPEDPRLLSDLAAALLSLSQSAEDVWSGLEAIEAAQQSLRLQPSLPAMFNLALALEQWKMHGRAIEAWMRYLEEDRSSGWAGEAARRLDRLEREEAEQRPLPGAGLEFPTLADNPWATRQRGERFLLTTWADHHLAGRPLQAEAALREAGALAATLPEGSGRLLEASLAAIHDAEGSEDHARLARLAHGHQGFGQALSLARQQQKKAALSLLKGVIQDFREARSPFELRARVLRALIAPEPDWQELQALDRLSDEYGFPSIAAEAKFIAAYRISLEGRLRAAVAAYRIARTRFDELNEREMSAVTSAMLAELLAALASNEKQLEAAGNELSAALSEGPWVADPWNRYSIYVVAASAAADRFKRAAVELRLEAADACEDLPEQDLCEVDSWLWAAAFEPDARTAQDFLHRAEAPLLAAQESEAKARSGIDLEAAKAAWLAGKDRSIREWNEASEMYRDVAIRYERLGRAPSAARARAARAQVLVHLERLDEASMEYRSGLEAFRAWDKSEPFVPENPDRQSPRELREVYEGLIDLELQASGSAASPAAFLLSEEMRDRLAPRLAGELRLLDEDDVRRFLGSSPRDTAFVEYAIFGEKAVAWLLADGRLDQVSFALAPDLDTSIRALTTAVSPEEWKRVAGRLYEDLLAPLVERLPAGTERLVVVPDSELYGLPFRALWNEASGQYLDEMLTLLLAPSLRAFFGSPASQPAAPTSEGGPVLSLGFGFFDPSLGLERLSWAEAEAAEVRAIHGASGAPRCPGRDWASFRRCAREAAVIHLASHASADSFSGDRTWLAFENETINLERLWRELPELRRRPLVVLSACESVATSGEGEGLGGLARPFIAKGARAVVGTLWRIPDRDAARFFPAFHSAYRESGDPADALRKARESLDAWEERPWIWGAVEAVAGEP